MRVAIIGASGKTGRKLVRESLKRVYEVTAVCRQSSVTKLDEFTTRNGFKGMTAAVVSEEATLTEVLAGCDAVVTVLIAAQRLKASELVTSLAKATAANGVKRLVFTAGEVTAARGGGEEYTLRQRLMLAIVPPIMWLTPYSPTDMLRASVLVGRQSDWEWTIVRAPHCPRRRRWGTVSARSLKFTRRMPCRAMTMRPACWILCESPSATGVPWRWWRSTQPRPRGQHRPRTLRQGRHPDYRCPPSK